MQDLVKDLPTNKKKREKKKREGMSCNLICIGPISIIMHAIAMAGFIL
jgi:hypothetical protein